MKLVLFGALAGAAVWLFIKAAAGTVAVAGLRRDISAACDTGIGI